MLRTVPLKYFYNNEPPKLKKKKTIAFKNYISIHVFSEIYKNSTVIVLLFTLRTSTQNQYQEAQIEKIKKFLRSFYKLKVRQHNNYK